jgi:hypothetical protein
LASGGGGAGAGFGADGVNGVGVSRPAGVGIGGAAGVIAPDCIDMPDKAPPICACASAAPPLPAIRDSAISATERRNVDPRVVVPKRCMM